MPEQSESTFERVSYAAPLALLAWLLVPLLLLLDSLSRFLLVLCYFLVDLRGWFVLATIALFVGALANRAGWHLGFTPWRPRLWMAYASLAAVTVVFGLASSPARRFESVIVGNEPKYLRYLENFYQGHGFDISHNVPFDEFVRGSADRSRQLSSLVGGAVRSARELAEDAVRWGRGTQRSFNRAEYQGSSFVKGKDGNRYQVHTPGLSFVLYPFYYLDRQYLTDEAGYPNELPKRLTSTSAGVLALYALSAMVMFRLLARYTGNPPLSWFLALTTLVTIPAAPFNFQYYPEVAAGVVIVTLCYAVLFGSEGRPGHAFLHGVLAGFLAWLHVRFLPVSMICAGGFAVAFRHSPRRVAAFAAGYFSCLALLGLYFYYITGSMLPSAMFDVMPSEGFHLRGIPLGIAGFMLDRGYGVLP